MKLWTAVRKQMYNLSRGRPIFLPRDGIGKANTFSNKAQGKKCGRGRKGAAESRVGRGGDVGRKGEEVLE